MAKRKRAENHADFAGPDADKEAIEKLASAAAKENEKRGKNTGEISDEALDRHIRMIKAAEGEWREARDKAAELQGVLRNRYKVAKNDGVDVEAMKLAFRIAERPASEFVAEHRNLGRYLRLMAAPVGTQFGLFDFLDARTDAAPGDEQSMEAEATLAGEHAGLNSEPKENNPHVAGTAPWFAWNNGHQVGADKLADNLHTGNVDPATGSPAH